MCPAGSRRVDSYALFACKLKLSQNFKICAEGAIFQTMTNTIQNYGITNKADKGISGLNPYFPDRYLKKVHTHPDANAHATLDTLHLLNLNHGSNYSPDSPVMILCRNLFPRRTYASGKNLQSSKIGGIISMSAVGCSLQPHMNYKMGRHM